MEKEKSKKGKSFYKELPADKNKALDKAIADIEKEFGKGAIMKMGEANARMNIEVIPTGILTLDFALGTGGVPRGRIIEIFGHESSGKTTVALHIIAEAQKTEGLAAFIDAEHALDPVYARKIGVDVDNLLISQPDNGEQALQIADALVSSGSLDIVVIDSVAALVPKAEIEGDMGDSHMGLHARLMSQALRKLTGSINKTKTTVVFINQLREKIGGYAPGGKTPTTTTGGRALKFYASVRIEVAKNKAIKQDDKFIGNITTATVVKNKVAPPFKKAGFDIMYGEGVSSEGMVLDLAVNLEIIAKSGSWYSYGEERLGQGKENIKAYLKENPQIAEEIEKKVREAITSGDKKTLSFIGNSDSESGEEDSPFSESEQFSEPSEAETSEEVF